MSYLIYNNKRVYSKGNENKYVTGSLIPGQIYFNGPGETVDFATIPDVTGNKIIKFGAYLSSPASILSMVIQDTTSDYVLFSYELVPETQLIELAVQIRNASPVIRKFYNIDSYVGQLMYITLEKTSNSIVSLSVNSNVLTSTSDGWFGYGSGNTAVLGGKNVSIWGLEVVGVHKWAGYPYGNTSAAWVDTIGNVDATVHGSPGTINLF